MKKAFLLLFIGSMLSGCQLFTKSAEFSATGKAFMSTLMTGDYEKCVSYFALEHPIAKGTDLDAMKAGFKQFHQVIEQEFGSDLDYKFTKWEKKFSFGTKPEMPANTTYGYMEFWNDKEFTALRFLFDDRSEKILTVNPIEIRGPIPSMTSFWLIGILALCVLLFNIYVIREIAKSQLRRKWLKYLAVACLNFPSIAFSTLTGLSLKMHIQLLFGISFSYQGFMNTGWLIGIPVGGIYWLWRLQVHKKRKAEEMQELELQKMYEQKDLLTAEPLFADEDHYSAKRQDNI